ncbi:MAG: hypothetical protein ACT443_00255 [Gemmatimonadota bacterium]
MHNVRHVVAAFAALAAMSAAAQTANAQQTLQKAALPKVSAELDAVRASLEKYQDPLVAVRDGYLSTQACIGYADGAMGVHFVNMSTVGPTVKPEKPQVLIYEPVDGKLELVAAEWFVPLATGVKEPPTLFGRQFDGPMDGHEPIMPKQLVHYDLHVWLWKENPKGVYGIVNPAVDCSKAVYAAIEPHASDAHVHK